MSRPTDQLALLRAVTVGDDRASSGAVFQGPLLKIAAKAAAPDCHRRGDLYTAVRGAGGHRTAVQISHHASRIRKHAVGHLNCGARGAPRHHTRVLPTDQTACVEPPLTRDGHLSSGRAIREFPRRVTRQAARIDLRTAPCCPNIQQEIGHLQIRHAAVFDVAEQASSGGFAIIFFL